LGESKKNKSPIVSRGDPSKKKKKKKKKRASTTCTLQKALLREVTDVWTSSKSKNGDAVWNCLEKFASKAWFAKRSISAQVKGKEGDQLPLGERKKNSGEDILKIFLASR